MPLPRFLISAAPILALGLLTACQDLTGRTEANNAAVALGYPFSESNECDGEVARQLNNAGIAPSQVESISYLDQTEVVDGRTVVVGYDANVRMANPPGLLVVDVEDDVCFTRQLYTRGDLELPGISSF